MEEMPTNFTTGFFLKENEFYQSTAQYLDLTSGNRVIQSQYPYRCIFRLLNMRV